MPQFTQQGHRFFVTYITGPSHVSLGLVFAEGDGQPHMIRKPPIGGCQHGEPDEARIKEAVLDGLTAVRNQAGVTLRAAEIIYVPDDSPRYEIYRHCAYLLAERVARRGEFTEMKSDGDPIP